MLAAARLQIAQGKLGGVVERLSGGSAKRGTLLDDTSFVEHLLGFQHRFLRLLQDRVDAAQNEHRQNHIRVFAALEQIAQHVVGDTPDKVGNPVKL